MCLREYDMVSARVRALRTCAHPSATADASSFCALVLAGGAEQPSAPRLTRLAFRAHTLVALLQRFSVRALKLRRTINAARLWPAFLWGTGGGHLLAHAIVIVVVVAAPFF
jgi:hypothetical protein